tara:strand:- start:381 stop:1073 length:693 start_codon:yes stop_codon:yes gene_type:complete
MISNSTIYNPIIGSNLGIPLNILQYIFTTTYYNENIITSDLIILQFAIGIFTYGTDRLLDALDYMKNKQEINSDKLIYYEFLIKNVNYNIFIIIVSYIYIFDTLKFNEETYPLLLLLTSTLFYRNFKENFGQFKALYIGSFWTLGSVILPCVLYDNNYDILNYPTIYIPSALLMFGSSNMLDIKDIDEDKEANIKTLPVLLGREKSELLSNSCIALGLVIYLTNFVDGTL